MSEEELKDLLEINCCEYHREIGKDAKKEIERLNNIIKDIQTYLKDYDYNSLKDESKIMLTNILAIIDGTIKIVK